jgi:hypothetical protein
VWVLVSVGSLFLLEGYDGPHLNPLALAIGIALIVGACAVSCYLAFGRWRDRPAPRGLAWMIPATAAFYLVCAIFGLFAGETYAIVALAAGLIPLTAATLIVATVRAKTSVEGRQLRDAAADDHRDPLPGIGADDSTPLGDTPEHSTSERVATPDRLPPKRR